MKKFTIGVFAAVFAALVLLLIFRDALFPGKTEAVRPKIIMPAPAGKSLETASKPQSSPQDIQLLSFVQLLPAETLLNAVTADINGDGLEDQVVLLRRTGNPELILLIGLYNPASSSYVRTIELPTGISQVKSFSFSVSDITGTHVNSLLYSGVTDSGETEFRAFLPASEDGVFSLKTIADFKSDSTIFVQQIQRSDPYYLSQATGESFPIWVYSTDSSQGAETLDQIQTQYSWNAMQGKYVKFSETKMTGKRIAAKELERIQDGTQATFEKFLSGLWYKPQASGTQMQYLFFDPESREIIFLVSDMQEVYLWSASMLRRSGMYITAVNAEIEGLVRRIDIALSSSDEIKLKVNDDVAMIIGEENIWDGAYKKMSGKSPILPIQKKKEIVPSSFVQYLATGTDSWVMGDNMTLSIKSNRYKVETPSAQDSGIFALTIFADSTLLNFRSSSQSGLFNGYYKVDIKQASASNKTVRETMTLTPVTVTVNSVFPAARPPMVFQRIQSEEAARAAPILGTK